MGPGVALNVVDRQLVKEEITVNDILSHHEAYCTNTTHTPFKSSGKIALGYVTPWNNHGYEIARKFASKFSHIAPVWYQIKLKSQKVVENGKSKSKVQILLEGGHDVDAHWIAEVQAGGAKVVPRFIVEAESAQMYVKLAQRPGGRSDSII